MKTRVVVAAAAVITAVGVALLLGKNDIRRFRLMHDM